DQVSSWLTVPATCLDASWGRDRELIIDAINLINNKVAGGDVNAFYCQQLLLARIYAVHMSLPRGDSAEGSVVMHEVTRLLENATIAGEDSWIPSGTFDNIPEDGKKYLSWLKRKARQHRVFKHPYYVEFINRHANREDLRTYVIQESLVDGRFDDLLAMMQ